MNGQFCPVCGEPVHEEAVIPPTAARIGDVWVLWFCDGCKWVSDWPGMPEFFRQRWPNRSKPITDPAKAERRR